MTTEMTAFPGSVTRLICEYVKEMSGLPSNVDRNLARLARVSTAWLEPALDLLWSRCNDFTQLFRAFPIDLMAKDGTVSVV